MIEIIVTLVIISMLVGAATLSLSNISPERALKRQAVKMKRLARQALSLSRSTQRPHSIFLNQDFFVLRETHMREEDLDELTEGEDKRPATFRVDDGEEELEGDLVRVVERYELDEGTEIKVMRFGEKEWRTPKNEDWGFYTSGICDPIMIRFETEQGYIEMEFNPLTAKVQIDGEGMEIYKQD